MVLKSTAKVFPWIYTTFYNGVILNVRHHKSFPMKTSLGLNLRKFSPANLSTFMVLMCLLICCIVFYKPTRSRNHARTLLLTFVQKNIPCEQL